MLTKFLLKISPAVLCCGLLMAQNLSFEAATVKPNDPEQNPGVASGFSYSGKALMLIGTLQALVRYAYDVDDTQIAGGPQWIDRDIYEINARSSTVATLPQLKQMLQPLLAERFAMTFHRETRQLPIYSLVVAKSGSKLQPADDGGTGFGSSRTSLRGTMNMSALASRLTASLHRTVIDKTGLAGNWKFDLQWAADDSTTEASIFTAIQEQLGLKLESAKGPVPVIVIDRAEKPTEN